MIWMETMERMATQWPKGKAKVIPEGDLRRREKK